MIFDTHAHLNFKDFDKDLKEILAGLKQKKMWVIIPGADYKSSARAVEIAGKEEEGVFSAIGFHPLSLREENFDKEKLEELARHKKVVAIGETGLDYLKIKKNSQEKDKQKDIFLEQIKMAKEFNLPLIIHCRMAHEDLLEILKKENGLQGVVHCFAGNWSEAKQYLNLGFYLGFTGIIFRPNAEMREVIEKTPLDKILIETDSPYLTPPEANSKRNEPLFVRFVAKEIARIKNTNQEKIEEITFENSRKLFRV